MLLFLGILRELRFGLIVSIGHLPEVGLHAVQFDLHQLHDGRYGRGHRVLGLVPVELREVPFGGDLPIPAAHVPIVELLIL